MIAGDFQKSDITLLPPPPLRIESSGLISFIIDVEMVTTQSYSYPLN